MSRQLEARSTEKDNFWCGSKNLETGQGGGRREEGDGRREEGEGRREKGEGRRERIPSKLLEVGVVTLNLAAKGGELFTHYRTGFCPEGIGSFDSL